MLSAWIIIFAESPLPDESSGTFRRFFTGSELASRTASSLPTQYKRTTAGSAAELVRALVDALIRVAGLRTDERAPQIAKDHPADTTWTTRNRRYMSCRKSRTTHRSPSGAAQRYVSSPHNS